MTRYNRSISPQSAAAVFPSAMIAVSLSAIVSAFILANSGFEFALKVKAFGAIIVIYLACCFAFYYLSSRRTRPKSKFDDDRIGELLFAIEEASEYFGGSLKPDDMFRLVSNKVNEIIPFAASALYMIDRTDDSMAMTQANGANANLLRQVVTDLKSGPVGRSVLSRKVEVEIRTTADDLSNSAAGTAGFRSSASLPLMDGGEVFGVLKLYSHSASAFNGAAVSILDAVGERVTPLIIGSISFERSLSNALTDPVTELPNERAFHLILENQIAETERNRHGRPLTILAIDIKGFDDINNRYGHASGDRMLAMIAHSIKDNLRQMDFFARSANDEFLAILPTATEDVSEEVIGRINTGLFTSRFYVIDNESVRPELNFGSATFGRDGETAATLLATARTRKQQSKTTAPGNVLWFPKELVN